MTRHGAPSADEAFNPERATAPWRRRLKASEPGRVAAALYRRRRLVVQMLRAPRAPRRGVPDAVRRSVRAVVWIPAGPGAMPGLRAAWESVQASSPGEVALLVTDDWSHDAHARAIRELVPEAVVVRTRVPSGGPPRLWPVTALAIRTALDHFDFTYLVKFDTDALAVGPSWVAAVGAAIDAAQGRGPTVGDEDVPGSIPAALSPTVPIGIAGAFIERPDGEQETDRPYHRGVLAGEAPHDARLAEWAQQAEEGGWPSGAIVQGGCLVMTRDYCEALQRGGALEYRPRLRTVVSEDLLLTLLAYTHGFRAASLGGPSGPLAVANKHLPRPLDELLDPDSCWRVAHSTKVGLDGEAEREIRAAAAQIRERWLTPAAKN